MTDSRARHSTLRSVWRWLRTGQAGQPGAGWFMELRKPTLWSKLTQAWRLIMGQRNIHPVPLLYIWVIAVGLVIGVVLQLTLDFPWWIPPLALFLIAWLFFLSTIWWPRKFADSRRHREMLISIFYPERGRRLSFARTAATLREATLGFYAPRDCGTFVPVAAGWSESSDGLDSIELRFVEGDGPGAVDAPLCMVETLAGHDPQRGRTAAGSAYLNIRMNALPPSKDPDEHHARFAAEMQLSHSIRDSSDWQASVVHIDGVPHEAERLKFGGYVFISCQYAEQWILITSPGATFERIDLTDLVEITDREPIIETMHATWFPKPSSEGA